MTDVEYYRSLALEELRKALEGAPENGVEDMALDTAVRSAKGLPPRPEGAAPYLRLFQPLPNPLPYGVLEKLVGAEKTDLWAPALNAALREAYMMSPLEISHFLAQILHETGGLRWLEELWGPTEAQMRYEGRADLGNILPGDGYLYRGRGVIHLTGRHNYTRAAKALNLPLVERPELAAQPRHAARIATWYWNQRGISRPALNDDLEAVTRAVNGGLNGLSDRRAWLQRAKSAYGIY